ncbi:MAG: rhodanese-like domain-containing protein [Chitinophagaceae bacterium]
MKNAYFLFLFSAFVSCKAQQGTANQMGSDEFEKSIAAGDVQVLDVRTSGEFQSGHIKNALQADWTQSKQFADRIQYVDKNKPVYVYCLAGGRSASAAEWMRSNGFKKVVNLTGGINAWKSAGKPLEGSSNEPQLSIEQYQASIPKDKTTLVDFGATWCPPCVKMNPVLDELQSNKELDFLLIKVDASIHTDVMKALNVEPIPVFIIYKEGKEVWRKQGVVSKEELLAQLK